MKKIIYFLALSLFLFSSCDNLSNNEIKQTNAASNKDNKSYVSFSIITDESRSIFPNTIETNIFTYELSCIFEDEVKLFINWDSYSEMLSSFQTTVELEEGKWTFILNAKNNDTIALTASTTVQLNKGVNPVELSLEEAESGNGDVDVTLYFSYNSFKKIKASLYSITNILLEDYLIENMSIDKKDTQYFVNYNLTNVPAGDYFIKFYCYQDEDDEKWINTKSEYIHIAPGNLSCGELYIIPEELNKKYSISYDTGIFKLNDNFNLITEFNSHETIQLPTIDDFSEENIHFNGWYKKNYRSEGYLTEISLGTSENLELVADISFVVTSENLSSFIENNENDTIPIYISDINPDLEEIGKIVKATTKNINLDISGCTELTSIPNNCFEWCKNLIGITMSDNILSIGECSLKATKITSITLPKNLQKIEQQAFYSCNELSYIILPDTVTEIGFLAFSNCEKLYSVNIPDNVTKIGDAAFQFCTSLYRIDIPDGVTTIGEYAFYKCYELKYVKMTDSVETIGKYAFNNCWKLNSITLSNNISELAEGVLGATPELRRFNFPDKLTIIGKAAFSCSLGKRYSEVITIPDTVTTIGVAAFELCPYLELIVPNSVTSIGEDAFRGIKTYKYFGSATGKPWGYSSSSN